MYEFEQNVKHQVTSDVHMNTDKRISVIIKAKEK